MHIKKYLIIIIALLLLYICNAYDMETFFPYTSDEQFYHFEIGDEELEMYFIGRNVTEETAYDITQKGFGKTGFFNINALNPSSLAGMILTFILLSFLILLVVFAEKSETPALVLFTSFYGFFFSIFVFVMISAVAGFIITAFSLLYMFRIGTFI